MTIFRFDPPMGLIGAFLDPRNNWHAGEIQTLTGYEEEEYAELKARQTHAGYATSDDDMEMLRQAANTLLALPTASREACEQFLGHDWRTALHKFLGNDQAK